MNSASTMTAEKSAANPVAGLLHVKVPALGTRKRGLPTWKVWKDFWVTAEACGRSGGCVGGSKVLKLSLSPIKLMYSTSSGGGGGGGSEDSRSTTRIHVPEGSTVRRTSSRTQAYVFAVFPAHSALALVYLAGRSESETQRWMSDLARFMEPDQIKESDAGQFSVTVLPGPLWSAVGLCGHMGRLGVRPSGLALRESSRVGGGDQQGKLLGAWGWRQIDHARCRLAAAALPEDDGKICVVRTTSLFPAGAGDLMLFCSKGRQLVRSLQTKTSSLLGSLHGGSQQAGSGYNHRVRRMSRSEGDLRLALSELTVMAPQSQRRQDEHGGAASLPKPQLASSLVSMGMRLALPVGRARSRSEHTTETPSSPSPDSCLSPSPTSGGSTPEEQDDILGSADDMSSEPGSEYASESRRVSNVSVASGVYETIDSDEDGDPRPPQAPPPILPPPLPPRGYKQRRNRGGLHAFFRLQRLWRSSSDSHVAKEEDEECELDEDVDRIYAEVMDPPPPPPPSLGTTFYVPNCTQQLLQPLSSSCSNLSLRHSLLVDTSELSKSSTCLLQESNGNNTSTAIPIPHKNMTTKVEDADLINSNVKAEWFLNKDYNDDVDHQPIYLPMSVSSSVEMGGSRPSSFNFDHVMMDQFPESHAITASEESIYVTMNADRKSSVTSELYALVTGIQPSSSLN